MIPVLHLKPLEKCKPPRSKFGAQNCEGRLGRQQSECVGGAWSESADSGVKYFSAAVKAFGVLKPARTFSPSRVLESGRHLTPGRRRVRNHAPILRSSGCTVWL